MTDWVAIIDEQTDPGAPGTANLWKAWTDRPVAIAEGATGAPKIRGRAFATATDFTAAGAYGVVTVTANDAENISAGLALVQGTITTTSLTYVTAYEFAVVSFTGSIRFKLSHSISIDTESELRILLNDVEQINWSTASAGSRSRDVTIVPGDVVKWQHRISAGSVNDPVSTVSARSQSGSVALVLVSGVERSDEL